MGFANFSDFIIVLLMTVFAGLATGIGGAIAVFIKNPPIKLLTFALGFSGGVMIYISFVELLGGANIALKEELGARPGALMALAAFFGGMLLSGIIDRLIPEDENPHEVHKFQTDKKGKPIGVKRTGLFLALAIGIHNFPEGLATFAAGLSSMELGLSIAIAIALHNIPEGLAVAVPLYMATGSRKKAFWFSLLTGLAEPVGALVGFLILAPFLTETVLQMLFALVAGIMVYITFDELLPLAESYGEHHAAIYGIVGGMLLMALVLAL